MDLATDRRVSQTWEENGYEAGRAPGLEPVCMAVEICRIFAGILRMMRSL